MYKEGFTSIGNTSQISNTNLQQPEKVKDVIFDSRVTDIILDNTHPEFQNEGGWNSIGTIYIEEINNVGKSNIVTATPLFPQSKTYPVVNEVVLILSLSPRDLSTFVIGATKYYYVTAINLWNHPQHNAYPNLNKTNLTPPSNIKSKEGIENGGQVEKDSPSTIAPPLNPPSGGTFSEENKVQPILPFAGDNILEGRFGNSLRFGSTAKSKSKLKNTWSGGEKSKNGDPITILRNGQPLDSKGNSWEPIIEDINNDMSSLYLTSNQKIPLNTDITTFPAISNDRPTPYKTFSTGSQALLNSDRIVLNSKSDNILLSSTKHISLSSNNDIGLYSKGGNINLMANMVTLGDISAKESVVLGDSFMGELSTILSLMSSLCTSISLEPQLGLSKVSAETLKTQIERFVKSKDRLLSKTVKSI